LPQAILNTLIDREAYRVCPLLPSGNFVSFCRARTMNVQAERLRQLERLGLVLPMLRIYRIDVPHKVEYLDDGRRYGDHGQLREDEAWDGAVRTELAGFDFSQRVVRNWLEHGNAWDPSSETSPHSATIDTEPRRHECYYSQFQIFELEHLLRALTASVEIEWALRDDGSIDPAWGDQLKSNLSEFAAHVVRRDTPVVDTEMSAICQVISDRYYPKTQGDERRLTIPMGLFHFSNWDWYAFAKRQRLKDDALRAQAFGDMARMLRLFYHDAFGDPLDAHGEFGRTFIERTPDIMAEDDPLRALELVANDFGVNPKPQLVLFVEGATELMVVPMLFGRMYATTLGVFGIELVSVSGVSNATGGTDSSYSALWRRIDYLHHHQTIAFVLLDNEGLAPTNIGKGLRRAASIHFPDRRVTRPNYVKLWKLSFELDNFNDAELAKALTRYADGRASFLAADVKHCRESASLPKKKGKLRTLDVLYTERMGRNLNKPQFGRALIDLMFDPATTRKPRHRPIVRFLEKVAERAARNHQPLTQAMWEYNQRTGYFGTLRPGAIARRKKPFGTPVRKPQKPK
jgi:phage tail protein X